MVSRASAILPLHGGKAPRWLFNRMVALAECIVDIIIDEFSVNGLMERLSDPWFFQSLSCVLGYDWHSSGTTTVTCGALKEAVDREGFELSICGGKGRTSLKTPQEILENGSILGLSSNKIEELIYSSRISAKVDNSLIQDGYKLYYHCFMFEKTGNWIVIQQGINEEKRNARRYHWGLEHRGFIIEPHGAILCDTKLDEILNMTNKKSEENRKTCVDIIRENPLKLKKMLLKPVPETQLRLDRWTKSNSSHLIMPRSLNWDTIRKAYEFQPRGYEELIKIRGIGPGTIRGLALVAELIYGSHASWVDPVKFNFAFGGKDGVPFPVDRKSMDETIDVLKTGIISSKVNNNERRRALKRLRTCVPTSTPSKLRTVIH